MLYGQYKFEKEATKDEIRFDMIKRIEDYRRNVNLFNTLSSIKSSTSTPPPPNTWYHSILHNIHPYPLHSLMTFLSNHHSPSITPYFWIFHHGLIQIKVKYVLQDNRFQGMNASEVIKRLLQ